MAQIFAPRANAIARAVVLGLLAAASTLAAGAVVATRSSLSTGVGNVVAQPVPFSHQHHVGGLGIDCRYCHGGAETSAFAGMPATETCMTCHSQLWTHATMLAPVRASLAEDVPVRWRRVHDLPDFVYFDHSVHVRNGVACESCHGRVDRMPLVWQAEPMTMAWCLDCHRDPAPRLRPRERVFDMGWKPPEDRDRRALGEALMARYRIHHRHLTDCSVCHR